MRSERASAGDASLIKFLILWLLGRSHKDLTIEYIVVMAEGDCYLLFMIVAKHSVENCPGGSVKPDKDFIKKTDESIKKSGVTLIDAYMDAPRHIFYFVIEAIDGAALNVAVEPLRLVGEVTITPVLKFFKEGNDWAKKIGIHV